MLQTTQSYHPEHWWPVPAVHGPETGLSRSAEGNIVRLFAASLPESVIALGRDGALAVDSG